MYAEYVKERENLETLQTDFGFVQYKIVGHECLISDLYILNKFRGDKLSHKLANDIVQIARESGCSILLCQVDLAANNVESSMKTILNYGFKIYKDSNGIPITLNQRIITFVKEIEVANG